jgi:hypothetical protein
MMRRSCRSESRCGIRLLDLRLLERHGRTIWELIRGEMSYVADLRVVDTVSVGHRSVDKFRRLIQLIAGLCTRPA